MSVLAERETATQITDRVDEITAQVFDRAGFPEDTNWSSMLLESGYRLTNGALDAPRISEEARHLIIEGEEHVTDLLAFERRSASSFEVAFAQLRGFDGFRGGEPTPRQLIEKIGTTPALSYGICVNGRSSSLSSRNALLAPGPQWDAFSDVLRRRVVEYGREPEQQQAIVLQEAETLLAVMKEFDVGRAAVEMTTQLKPIRYED